MIEVIPYLFLGCGKDVKTENIFSLRLSGVKAIVNCMTDCETSLQLFPLGFESFRVSVDDIGNEEIHEYFDSACNFIESFISRKEAVLVHCKAGISRSVTIVLSFLIGNRGLCLRDSFIYLLSKQSIACPNIGFMEQLCNYEKKIRGDISLDLFKYISWYADAERYRKAIPDLNI